MEIFCPGDNCFFPLRNGADKSRLPSIFPPVRHFPTVPNRFISGVPGKGQNVFVPPGAPRIPEKEHREKVSVPCIAFARRPYYNKRVERAAGRAPETMRRPVKAAGRRAGIFRHGTKADDLVVILEVFDISGQNEQAAERGTAFLGGETSGFYLRRGKRAFDVAAALAGLVFCSPLMLFAAVGVRLGSRGSVIFKQERLGLGGKAFVIYKFRSMRIDAENDGPAWARKNDGRVTRFGRFIRKYHLDELPQLVNILRGDMSMVGPRPERAYFYERFEREIPEFTDRLAVKPGLTGWAQVNGGYDIGPKEKCRYDKEYIRRVSLRTDIAILLRTVVVVLRGLGAR